MPKKSITISQRAHKDIESIGTSMESHSIHRADQFYNAVGETFSMLYNFPNIGHLARHSTRPSIRIYRIKKFPLYNMYHTTQDDTVHILRIAHTNRDIDRLSIHINPE